MAPLRAWLRPRSRSLSHALPNKSKKPWLLLEPLEDRTLLTQGAVPLAVVPPPAMDQPAVEGFYQVILGRKPQPDEASGWVQGMQGGLTIDQVVQGFLTSTEYQTLQVEQHYADLLGRQPEPGVVPLWMNAMEATGDGNVLPEGILSSQEYYARHNGDPSMFVAALYADVLGRSPDVTGWNAWTAGLRRGMSRAQIAAGFLDSHEAHFLIVQDAYQTLLLRAPEAEGLNAWTGGLDQGLTTEQLIERIAGSPEFARLAEQRLFPSASAPAAA